MNEDFVESLLGPPAEQSLEQLSERRAKVDYWRRTKSGQLVGFKGTPGKGKPVTGHPSVLKQLGTKAKSAGQRVRRLKKKHKKARGKNREKIGKDLDQAHIDRLGAADKLARHRKKHGRKGKKRKKKTESMGPFEQQVEQSYAGVSGESLIEQSSSPRLQTGDRIRVHGDAMLKGLKGGKVYEVINVSHRERGTKSGQVYTLKPSRGRSVKSLVKHWASDVDAMMNSFNRGDNNGIEVL